MKHTMRWLRKTIICSIAFGISTILAISSAHAEWKHTLHSDGFVNASNCSASNSNACMGLRCIPQDGGMYWYVSSADSADASVESRVSFTIDDHTRILMNFGRVSGSSRTMELEGQYVPAEHGVFVDALKRGSQVIVQSDLTGRFTVSLRGSNGALASAIDGCLNILENLTSGTSTNTAPLESPSSQPNDIPTIIQQVFVANSCEASEEQIFNAIMTHHDAWTANQSIRWFTENSTFLQNYEVLERGPNDPIIFRSLNPNNCGKTKGTVANEPALSNAAQWLVNEAIQEGCQGQGGLFDPQGIYVGDLNGDGRDDLLLMHEKIQCEGMPSISIFCGAALCENFVYLRQGQLLKQETSFLGFGPTVGEGERPSITYYSRDGSEHSLGWNGRSFVER